jgi:hypothetical protein
VTVSFSCADTGPVQSGIDINTVAGETVTTEGKDQSVTNTGVCIDVAGNTADPVTVSNINIDKTSPEVTITLPGTGEYVQNQSITATWSATDALSGVVSPASGTESIDTSSVGTKTLTLPAGVAMDKAGNSSLEVTISYSVIEDTGDPDTVYPQKWATGDGTVENPWANNCINEALNFVPDGGTIFLKAGYYTLSNTLWSKTKSYNLIGEGMGNSIIVLDIEDGNGIFVSTDYCTLKGFTIDGDSQANDSASLINIQDCDYILLENIEVKNAGKVGINLFQANHLLLQNIYAHDNYEHGVHSNSATKGRNMYNTYQDIYCWDNGVHGFDDNGSGIVRPIEQLYNIYDNIQCWDNGSHGIAVVQQKSGALSNSFASGNGKNGMYLDAIEDFSINSCLLTLSVERGIKMYNSEKINFTNVIVKNNNSGMVFRGCSNIELITCQSYDDRGLCQPFGGSFLW